ncbi:MAG: 1-acyl-sn-glycerol-3-phosphate acyltransferase [Alphaproteobacteria bacterium]|nr:1-acyl-sn-glycerol-3-phosphate acyltransferase [Alphaproteobacteria bacterium]
MSFLRSLAFLLWFAAVTIVMGTLALPLLLGPRKAALWLSQKWAAATLWGLKVFAGVDWRITGSVPRAPVLVAVKHMSTWDTLAIHLALGDPGIVLKRSLLWIPFFGWYVAKTSAIPIDRGGGAATLWAMTKAAQKVLAQGRPVVIFPEGTRKKPAAPPDYKPGVAGLYRQLEVACVPVALNSGRYWQGFWKRPGTITLAFLEPIPPGLKRAEFMSLLQERIETATSALLAG